MKIMAYVYFGAGFVGGEDTITSFVKKEATKLHIVSVCSEKIPQYDYSTYLYLDSGSQYADLSIDNEAIGEFAVEAYAYGTSTANSNLHLCLLVGQKIGSLEFMGKKAIYTKGEYKDGEFLGRFYCKGGSDQSPLRVRITANGTSTKPVYVLLNFKAISKDDIDKGSVTSISSIVANTKDSLSSLIIETSGDYRLCAVQNPSPM